MGNGRSGMDACPASVCDDLISGGPSLPLQADQRVLLHVSATSLPSPLLKFKLRMEFSQTLKGSNFNELWGQLT